MWLFKLSGSLLLVLVLPLYAWGTNLSSSMDQRYAPYADWSAQLDPERLEAEIQVESWWQSPEEIREGRKESALPLSGLHVALDPGHIGGQWAEAEARNFQIGPDAFPVREGELVLEVAHLVRARLMELGAKVTLLREGIAPVNPKSPEAYFEEALNNVPYPEKVTLASLKDYALALRREVNRMYLVSGELIERARVVNEQIQPDLLLSLHINAAPWPKGKDGQTKYELVDSNHTHVLIFGCLSDGELSSARQQKQLIEKLKNGSAAIEKKLGQALGVSLGEATALPPSKYSGKNAIRLEGCTPYLWARNLLLLRYVKCPVVLLEPYIANSKGTYPRIQKAIQDRRAGQPLAEDDILVEYANAVVEGILQVYGP